MVRTARTRRGEPSGAPRRQRLLRRSRLGFCRAPGASATRCVVAGYRTGVADGSSSHTFVAFDDESAADAFASNVMAKIENPRRAGVENVSQTDEEVTAHTTEPR